MNSRTRGQDFLSDISSLVNRVRTSELVTYGDEPEGSSVSDQHSIVVGTISVPVTSALSASAVPFAPASASAPTSVSGSEPASQPTYAAVCEEITPLTASVSNSREV